MNLETIVKEPNTQIIDVRTPAEFAGGSVFGAVNIPLNEIPDHLDQFKLSENPIVFCCASGMRSGQATGFLQANGFKNAFNGGPWTDVNYLKNK